MRSHLALTALAVSWSASAAELPALRVRPQTIDAKISIGYGLVIADVDGDGKVDILLADQKQIVWYRNPTWEKFVMAENLTPKDNVCIAARDLDGDGKCEVAVGAEWNPSDTVNSGAVFLLEAPTDRKQRWKPVKLPHEPTTHRMQWMQRRNQKWFLAVLPLHGRGNKNNAGDGVKFFGYDWPWKEGNQPFSIFDAETAVHATHNFEVVRFPEALVATQEGVKRITIHDSDWNHSLVSQVSVAPAGEVRAGHAPDRSGFTATIEPMHGNQLVHYSSDILHPSKRTVLDESLVQGHGLATGDLLGVGSDQIVVGWRANGRPGEKVGIKLYATTAPDGSAWTMHAMVDDNQMACEDLKLADLNGDGRLDVIAAGRATKNVIIYWNETGAAK